MALELRELEDAIGMKILKPCFPLLTHCICNREVRYKIGCSDDPSRRIGDLSTPGKLELIDQYFHVESEKLERAMHERHRTKRESRKSEWFDLSSNEVADFGRACHEEAIKLSPPKVQPPSGSIFPYRLVVRTSPIEKGAVAMNAYVADGRNDGDSYSPSQEFITAATKLILAHADAKRSGKLTKKSLD